MPASFDPRRQAEAGLSLCGNCPHQCDRIRSYSRADWIRVACRGAPTASAVRYRLAARGARHCLHCSLVKRGVRRCPALDRRPCRPCFGMCGSQTAGRRRSRRHRYDSNVRRRGRAAGATTKRFDQAPNRPYVVLRRDNRLSVRAGRSMPPCADRANIDALGPLNESTSLTVRAFVRSLPMLNERTNRTSLTSTSVNLLLVRAACRRRDAA